MNSLNTLKSALYKLKKEEIKSLINFLKYHQKQLNDQSLKSIQLVEFLLSERNISSNGLQIKLYGKLNYKAFNKLVIRLKDKIYEVILFSTNLSKKYYTDRNKTIFDLKKRLIQNEILYSRGITDDFESVQNKIILKAKKYEIYECLIEALHAKQRYLGFRLGSSAHNKLDDEIALYEEKRKIALRARNIFSSIASKINRAVSFEEYEVELKEAITTLENDYEKTKSGTVGYFLFFLQTEYFQNREDYNKAGEILTELFELLKSNVSVYTKVRMGDVLTNISNNDLFRFKFDAVIQNSEEAVKYYSENLVNQGIARELEFYGLFYSGEITKSEQLIEELYHLSRTSNTPFLYAKRSYLLACMKTLKREFHESNQLLSEVSEIEKDKEGWNIGKRILTIINRIETEDFESVDLEIQNLEKHIKRTLKIKHVRKRNILILRILLKLINEQFDFQKVYKSRHRYFNQLESNDAHYRWQIKSPELIIFHEWFFSKIENRPYNHNAAIEKEKKRNLEIDNQPPSV